MEKYYKINEVSKLYDIGIDALRYYEKIGILSPQRAKNGYRYYSLTELQKIQILKELKSLSFSLEDIKEYLNKKNLATTTSLLQKEVDIITDKVIQLNEMKKNITNLLNTVQNSENIFAEEYEIVHKIDLPFRKCLSVQENVQEKIILL